MDARPSIKWTCTRPLQGLVQLSHVPSFRYLEEDYKRPRSPIDRIKSLFRGKSQKDNNAGTSGASTSGTSSNYHSYNPGGPTTGTTVGSRYSTADKIYGSYPSSTQTPSSSQYSKRYTGGTCTRV